MRWELSFIRLAVIQTQEWTAVLKKTIPVSKLHPTEAAFLCWMSNGVWSIPYPKIWQIAQRWIHMTFLVLMRLRDLGKFWQAPELLSYEVFHLCRSRISPTVILKLAETAQWVIPGRPGWMGLLHSCLHPVTALLFHSCRHLFQADTADSETKAATQERSTGEMLARFYCLYILSSKYQINSQCQRRLLN